MKSEPTAYSIADLAREGSTIWDGVRNYQARNFLREMVPGDRVFFYHSNTKTPAIVGLMTVTASQVIDPTQFDPHSAYFDPKATPEKPRWHTVTVAYGCTFDHGVSLATLKATFSPEELTLVRRGNRLSVMPIDEAIAQRIMALTAVGGG